MKIFLLLSLAVLTGCTSQTSFPEIERGYFDILTVCGRGEKFCDPRYDVAEKISEHDRHLRALDHEVTGVETGCRLEKICEEKLCCSDGEGNCPRNCGEKCEVKVLCEGEMKEVDAYSLQ